MSKNNKNNKKVEYSNTISLLMKKYSVVGIILLVLVVFGLVLGLSYAFFTTTVKAKEFVIYTGNLKVDYQKKTNVINIENLYPMTNTEGLTQSAHEFTVTNNGSIDARYQVRLELDTTEKNMVPIEYIKLAYSMDGGDYSTPVLLSDLDSSLAFIRNVILTPTQSNTIGIKLWIDINASNDIQGKIFKAKVVVDSIQNVEDGYVVNTAPIIYLNKDSSGNQDMIINTNSTYIELGVSRITDDKQVFTKNDVTTTYEYYDGTTTTSVSAVDTSKTGIYYVTYSIKDNDNNTGKVVRVVAVGDKKSLKIYHDVESVVNSFDANSLKEVIMCSYIDSNDRMYFDCKIHDTIENALASKTKGAVIMTSDIERSVHVMINSDKEIALELNNKTMSFTSTYSLCNTGILNINEKTTGTIIGVSRPILAYGVTNVYNGEFINTMDTNDGAATFVVNAYGTLNVYGDKVTFDENGNYVSGTYIKGANNSCVNLTGGSINVHGGTIEMTGSLAAIRSNYNGTVAINIHDGEIIGATYGVGLDPNCSATSSVNVYGGSITVDQYYGVYNNSVGTINIFGGVITGNLSVINKSTGVININQKDKSLYITSLSQVWNPAIRNASSGTINISGNEADNCTSNSLDTTSGLCIYVEGDKNYTKDTANTAVANTGNDDIGGIINIDGGTYYAGHIAVSNHFAGTINIKNGKFLSENVGIFNIRTGNINICNAKINASNYDLSSGADATGLINYSSSVIFTSGNITPTINGNTSNIVPNYTGTCIVE